MQALRAFVFCLLAPVMTGFGFLAAVVGLIPDPRKGRIGHAVLSLWGRTMVAMAGGRLVVVHPERLAPKEPRVLVSNHCSYLDITAMVGAFPGQLRIVARRSLFWFPFIGWYIVLGGHFFVDRDDPRQALRLMERIGMRMRRDGLSALIFPEGTRSLDGRLQPLKPGTFFLPMSVGAAVQPVAIVGTGLILPKGAWAPLRSARIELRVGEPIPATSASGSAARKELAEAVRRSLVALGVPEATPSA